MVVSRHTFFFSNNFKKYPEVWILGNFLAIIAWQSETKLVPDDIASETKGQNLLWSYS